MNRRDFLKLIHAGIASAAGLYLSPRIVSQMQDIIEEPKSRLMPVAKPMSLYDELWAQDGDVLSDLMPYLAPGGTLYARNVSVFIDEPIYPDSQYRIDLDHVNIEYTYPRETDLIVFREPHSSGRLHYLTNCHFRPYMSVEENTVTNCSMGVAA